MAYPLPPLPPLPPVPRTFGEFLRREWEERPIGLMFPIACFTMGIGLIVIAIDMGLWF